MSGIIQHNVPLCIGGKAQKKDSTAQRRRSDVSPLHRCVISHSDTQQNGNPILIYMMIPFIVISLEFSLPLVQSVKKNPKKTVLLIQQPNDDQRMV